jgi:hypothetical protein
MIRYNSTLGETEYYDGILWRSISDSNPEATGGNIIDTDIGGVPYRIHIFTTTGNSTFTVSKGGQVEYLIVAGGAGGGSKTKGSSGGTAGGGGGGGGGILTGTTKITSQTYTITVGAGGQGGGFPSGGGSTQNGGNGGNSSAFGLTAIGGGGGGRNGDSGVSGGSGGGSGTTGLAGGSGTAGQGNNGGSSTTNNGYPRGGGGGAGSVGSDGIVGKAGDGGVGIISNITGISQWYAGGGGGAMRIGSTSAGAAFGGLGGGQKGGIQSGSSIIDGFYGDSLPLPRAPNSTGGGGGGQAGNSVNLLGHGGFGGSGIVVVRYPRNISTATSPNRTIISTLPNSFNIIQDGLVLHFDAANPQSHPGSGTAWQNLQRGDLNAAAVGGTPSYNNANGGVTIVSGNNWSVPDDISLKLTGTRTLIAWFKMSALTGGAGIAGKSNSSVNGLALGYGWSNGGFMALAWNASNSPAIPRDLQRDINQWNYLVALIDSSSNRVIYAFDALGVRTATSGASAQSWDNTLPFGIGAANGNGQSRVPAGSQFGSVLVYDRQLSFDELQQNFNSTRGRYGI